MLRTPGPPYAVSAVEFRFPALAALAGRLPLGAGRETALSTLLVARLAADAVPAGTLPADARRSRAAACVQWLTTTCPDTRVRAACAAAANASASDNGTVLTASLARVIEVAGPVLGPSGRGELNALVRALEARLTAGSK